MALTAKQSDFISKIGTYALKYAPIFDVRVVSPIIAQAILESNWGDSKLSASYHNYFGLKCGSKWTGQSVNLATKEEYTAGTVVDITDTYTFENFVIPIVDFLSEHGLHGFFGSGMCIIDNTDEAPFDVIGCTFTVDGGNVTITD